MNREIKFRAWLTPETAKVDEPTMVYQADFNPGRLFAYMQPTNGVQIMQYTGLKDVHGKEIYEGDAPGGIWEECEVFWCDQCHGWALKMIQVDHCHSCDGDFMWLDFVDEVNEGKVEIIGNIYENPELMETVE